VADSPSKIFRKRIQKLQKAKDALTSGKDGADLGEFIVETIVQRTRSGKAPERDDGQNSSLKPLSNSYKQVRAGKIYFYEDDNGNLRVAKGRGSRHPDLDQTTTPNKSNLTFTGQLLRSIKYRLVGDSIIIEPTGSRQRLSTQKTGSAPSNKKVAEYVAAAGRKFLLLSGPDRRQVLLKIQQLLRKSLD